MKNSPLKYNGRGDQGGFGGLNGVPIQGEDVPSNGPRINSQPVECNKTRIDVCKNSLHLRWGMEIRINDQRPVTSNGTDTPVVIESITYSGTPGDMTASIQLSHDIDDQLSEGLNVTFHGDRNLNFNPNRKITGLNVIDGMIYWTDNYSEPKKVNIERGKEGSKSWKYGAGWDGSLASIDPYTWPGCAANDNIACYSDFDQHTKLIVEDEHIMDCENSTSTCYIYGCTDPLATNYNPNANFDDGSCVIPPPVVYGCDNGTFGTDNIGACNSGMAYWSASVTGNINGDYNTNDTGLCVFPDDCEICDGTGGVMFDPACSSCNDSGATNYSGTADDCQGISGGSDISCCRYCLDPTATNYYGSTNTYDCSGTLNGTDYSGCCTYPGAAVDGCTDPMFPNYNPLATNDDGSCARFCDGSALTDFYPPLNVIQGAGFTSTTDYEYPNSEHRIANIIARVPSLSNIDQRQHKYPVVSSNQSHYGPNGEPLLRKRNVKWKLGLHRAFNGPALSNDANPPIPYFTPQWINANLSPGTFHYPYESVLQGYGHPSGTAVAKVAYCRFRELYFHCPDDLIAFVNNLPDYFGNFESDRIIMTNDFLTGYGITSGPTYATNPNSALNAFVPGNQYTLTSAQEFYGSGIGGNANTSGIEYYARRIIEAPISEGGKGYTSQRFIDGLDSTATCGACDVSSGGGGRPNMPFQINYLSSQVTINDENVCLHPTQPGYTMKYIADAFVGDCQIGTAQSYWNPACEDAVSDNPCM